MDDDVRALNERALTAEEKAQNAHWAEIGRAIIEGRIARAGGCSGRGGLAHLVLDMLSRVEWCKALAQTNRYEEEVRLLREEMRRTIAYGETAAWEWERLASEELPGASGELTEGRHAYAFEHAATERARCWKLEERWRAILQKADAFLSGDQTAAAAAAPAASAAVTVMMEMADELDPEEEEARLEGGGTRRTIFRRCPGIEPVLVIVYTTVNNWAFSLRIDVFYCIAGFRQEYSWNIKR
ncbi:CxC2 domain-containing protein [Mycena venus]|uniref:CxC2 domain-containing protein n=1 Tax=Mycena venus TaxID=2733690 RepID=A0A8H6YBP2_9AGAR|nr:CxC2 domain-containing protein [Mycena venus]